MWRVVEVAKESTGQLMYYYHGMYPKRSTAQGQLTRLKNGNPQFYDGWLERCDVIWHKIRD